MELFRKKNQATTLVFPLLSASSDGYYTQSTWAGMTNQLISAYSWSDSVTLPNSTTISGTPQQLGSTGEWSLSATASEMNPNSGNDDYMVIKLNADEIKEQTILVILSDYSIQESITVSNITSAAVQDILSGTVDTKTLSDIFTILLADAVGNVNRVNQVFTYYKQDGTTVAFQNTSTSLTRRRTD